MKLSNAHPSFSVSNIDSCRDALDQALRLALGTSQPALRRQALERAAECLIHPRLILESALLTDLHPWRQDAFVVSDAFEAVTNGMEEPGVLDDLEELEADSPFQPWRHLILALHFFYENLDEAVDAHLAQIPSSSPVAVLGKALQALVQKSPTQLPSQGIQKLIDQVAQPDPRVQRWVQDVSEGLENDDEILFWESLADWLEAIASEAPDRAQAAVLWAWGQLEWRDFDEQTLLDLAATHWGRAESFRLAALGTLGWDPEGAALLWLRFLVSAIRDEAALTPRIQEARLLLDRFQGAAEQNGPPATEWQETWTGLSRSWNAEVQLRGRADLALTIQRPGPSPSSPKASADGQLDLFAS